MKRLALVLLAAAALGLGCSSAPAPSAPPAAPANIGSLNPADAAKRLQFQPGDTLEVRQTVLGIGAKLPDLTGSNRGVRFVTIRRFATQNFAELDWTSQIEKLEDAGTSTLPTIVHTNATGSLTAIDLRAAHAMFLPVYWQTRDQTLSREKSALWLADDAFNELSRTGQTTLNVGVTDQTASAILKNLTDLKNAWARLRNQATEASSNQDLSLLKADTERTEWPLRVNGQDVTVSAIHAKNWFADMVILDNRQNPLVLKLTLNPLLAGADLATHQGLKSLFGFEVTNLKVASAQ